MTNQELVSTVEICIREDGALHMAECVINVESGTILPQFVSLNQSATLNKNNPQVMKELNFS